MDEISISVKTNPEITKKYVYIIRMTNTSYYKIGISNNLKSRLKELQTATPFELQLIYKKHFESFHLIENYLHNTFINKHIRGEWFELQIYDLNSLKNFLKNLEHHSELQNELKRKLIATKKYRKKSTQFNKEIKSSVFFERVRISPKNLDINSDWRIEFNAKENKNDEFKRFRIRGGLKQAKNKTERIIMAEQLMLHVIRALEAGYNPFKSKISIIKFNP